MLTKVFSSQCVVKMARTATFCRGILFSLLHKFVLVEVFHILHSSGDYIYIYIERKRERENQEPALYVKNVHMDPINLQFLAN